MNPRGRRNRRGEPHAPVASRPPCPAVVLADNLDVPEVQRRTTREFTRLLGADTSILFSRADARGVSAAVAGYHVPKELLDPACRVSLGDVPPFIVEALATHRPVASRDVAHDPRFDHPLIRGMKRQAKSILYTPLFSKGTICGAFLSFWWNEYHDVTEDELCLAEGVADQLAIALENGTRFAEADRRAGGLARGGRSPPRRHPGRGERAPGARPDGGAGPCRLVCDRPRRRAPGAHQDGRGSP